MSNEYIVKLYDLDLIRFKVQMNMYGQIEYTDVQINKQYEHLLPPAFKEIGIEKWLEWRIIPKNREFVHKVLSSIGNPNHPIEVIKVSLGLSVTDSYWVVPRNFKGKFKDYNLFENEFSKALELVAFTGYDTKIKGIATSPEFTTNGMLKKCWRKVDGKLYLYKGGTSGFANTGLEPYSEYYAYQIAEKMGLNVVEYNLRKYKKQLVSVCEAFTDINTSYVPIGLLLKTNKLEEVIEVYGEQNFADMVTFDAIICNTDRHRGNFGLLRDSRTGVYKGASPIFDNGLSLFNYAMKSDFKDIMGYARGRINAFDADQVTMAKKVMTNIQRERVRKLINFKFKRHPSYNLPEWRLKAIEKYIQIRVKELLG